MDAKITADITFNSGVVVRIVIAWNLEQGRGYPVSIETLNGGNMTEIIRDAYNLCWLIHYHCEKHAITIRQGTIPPIIWGRGPKILSSDLAISREL
jgi:hypothetical protein